MTSKKQTGRQQLPQENPVPVADLQGLETLNNLSRAGNFNRWMYEAIAPHCQGRLLEVGSGIGNLSAHFLREGHSIMLSDLRSDYCGRLSASFGHFSNLLGIGQLDLAHPEFRNRHRPLLGTFDTVVALNVIEHIEDDLDALRNCHSLLRRGGRMIVLVPAFQWLYNGMDLQLQHHRRYTASSLRLLFSAAGLRVKKVRYFNALGIPGWFISGRIQRNQLPPPYQLALFDALVPFARLLDCCFSRLFGLSVISVGEV